jgi:SprT protein
MRVYGNYASEALKNTIQQYHAEAIQMMPEIADIEIYTHLNERMRSNGGTASVRNGVGYISLNYRLHRDNGWTNLKQTYLHELAHVVQRIKYGSRVKSHGREWQAIMRQLGASPDRCHTMDVSSYQNKQRRWAYKCSCQTFQLTTTRHNKIMRGAGYTCKRCKQKLVRA